MAEIIETRIADDDHVVQTIEGRGNRYCLTPCSECPWRTRNAGMFPAEAFRLSARVAYDMAENTFGCHMGSNEDPLTCAGFILRGADDNAQIRINQFRGQMLDVREGGADLFYSYREMAIANGVDPDDDVLAPCMPEAREREQYGNQKSSRA